MLGGKGGCIPPMLGGKGGAPRPAAQSAKARPE